MKVALLVVTLAHAVSCGNIRRTSSLLAPAGVTYVDGSYHAGLAAGPVAYSAPVYQSSAPAVAVASQPVVQTATVTGPGLAVASSPVVQTAALSAPALAVASQPVVQTAAVAAAPVAFAAPATKYAAVPTVQHVPGVADVPVTRIDAQPGVIRNTVDVARPAVKTQRFEVRRPAIQKQFYDIEERVVVRPAGSAVVELEEPSSRTQKGPSVIRPAEGSVSISGVTSGVTSVTPAPIELPSVEINLSRGPGPVGPVGPEGPVGPTISPSGEVGGSFVASPAPPESARGFVASPAPPSAPAIASSPTVGYTGSSLSVASAPSIGYTTNSISAPSAPAVEYSRGPISISSASSFDYSRNSINVVSAPVEYSRTSYQVPVAQASPVIATVTPAPSVSFTRASNAAASVVAAAAPAVTSVSPAPVSVNYARGSYPTQTFSGAVQTSQISAAPVNTVSLSAPVAAPVNTVSLSAPVAAPVNTVSLSAPVATPVSSGITSISAGTSGIATVAAASPSVTISTTPAPQIIQSTPTPAYSEGVVSLNSAEYNFGRSGVVRQGYQSAPIRASVQQAYSAPAAESVFRSDVRGFTAQSAPSRGSLIVNYPNSLNLVPQAAPVYERNLQSEINQDNQQKLIQLLTAKGGVAEVGFGRSGPASYPVEAGGVRARVISATPAPAFSAPAGERVNTRRVVVSRPIETLQEVEVSEPVTKLERVRVDQPTLIKTARQEVVRVPTSVPVYGKALAPVEEAPVAYSAGWK